RRRPAGGAGGRHGSRGAAAASPHHAGAGPALRRGRRSRRSRPGRHGAAVAAADGRRDPAGAVSQALAAGTDVALASLGARAFEIPLDAPESDGTAEWDSTVMVVVEAHAGGETGLGYTYGSLAPRALHRRPPAP